MTDLEIFDDGSNLYVDSRLIAERLGIEHRSFLVTLDNYQTQIEQAFGILRFEIAEIDGRGRPRRYAFLNEDQATFVMTLSRNSPEVVQCKIDLVKAFSKAKELLKQRQDAVRQIPYWYQRIKLALTDSSQPLQSGYFCVYLGMMNFFQEVEVRLSYVLPDLNPETDEYVVPDISIGLRFNDWLRSEDAAARLKRKELLGSEKIVDFRPARWNKDKRTHERVWVPKGTHHDEIRIYNHVYPKCSHGEYQVQSARSYPNQYLAIFLYYLEEIWIPQHFKPYLLKKSPEAWDYLETRLMQLSPQQKHALRETLVGKLLPLLPPASES